MTTDYDYSDDAYSELEKEAKKDDRVGDHVMMVTKTEVGTFPKTGDNYLKIRGVLTSAFNTKVDITFGSIPSPEEVKRDKGTWEPSKKKAIASTISMVKALAGYGKKPDTVSEGDTLNVKTVKNREGFIRVVAILAPGAATKAADDSSIPF